MNIQYSASDVDWVTQLAGFIGVLVGGLIACWTTHLFERKRLLRVQKALAYRAIFDVARAADDLAKLNIHMQEAVASTSDSRSRGMKIASLVGFRRDPIRFDAETLGLVADMKNPALVQSMIDVESGHHVALVSFFKLVELRDRIGHSGIAEPLDGGLRFDLSGESARTIMPALMEIESLARSLEDILPSIAEDAAGLRSKLGPALKTHYKFDHFVTFLPI